MKIAVCVKQVPDSETRINLAAPAAQLDQSGFTRVLNPYDAYAVEEAVKIKEAGEEVEVTTVDYFGHTEEHGKLRRAFVYTGPMWAVWAHYFPQTEIVK